MKLSAYPITLALVLLGASCSSELPPGREPQPIPERRPEAAPRLGLFALKASNGSYVSCRMIADTAGITVLRADRPAIGPNEVFTGWYGDDGRFGIRASNGKYIAVDRNMDGTLVADRDHVGDWETFELVDAGNGLFALKNSNGSFACAHYDLPGEENGMLKADRAEANEWERYTVVQDPVIGQ